MNRMRPYRFLLFLPFALLTSCVTSSDMDSVKNQVTDLQDQIAELKRQVSSKEEVQQLNSRIVQQSESLLQSNAEVTTKVGQIDDKLQNVQGSIEQTTYRVDTLAQQLTQAQRDIADLKNSRSASPAGASPPGTIQDEVNVESSSSSDPLEVYQSAYRDYQRGSFDLALEGFRDFVKENPSSDLADNAAYWIGESFYSQKKYRDAIQQFDSVINTYPKSEKVPASLLKKGYAFVELGQRAQGIVQLQYVVHEHPRSEESPLARQKLKALGIETN